MKHHRTTAQKIFSLLTGGLLVFQSLAPGLSAIPQVFAQDENPSPTQEVTPSDTPTDTPSPTDTVSPTPTEEVTPTPTAEVTPEATPTDTITPTPSDTPTDTLIPTDTVSPTPTDVSQPQNNSPPSNDNNSNSNNQQGQILDGVSATATPTPTPAPVEQGTLAVAVLPNVQAATLDLSVTDYSSAKLTTDKADYAPTDVVVVTGTGFVAGQTYTIVISSADEPAVSHEDSVTADGQGELLYTYQLDGISRPNYKIEVKIGETVIATTTFTDPTSKVDICHRTGSNSNPYTPAQADKTADAGGHDGHNGPVWFSGITVAWGDIIPPFTYSGGSYPGKNWTTAGQAFLNNSCNVPGTITIVKDTIGSDGTFNFTSTGGNGLPSNFSIATSSHTGSVTYANLLTGNSNGDYTITETSPNGYSLTSLNCNARDHSTSVSTSLSNRKATINNLQDGDTVTCTFTNTAQTPPTLKLVKTVDYGPAQPGDWTLTASGTTNGFSDAGNSTTFHTVSAGIAYTLSESSISGWTQYGNWQCDGGSLQGNAVTLTAGQNVTCTITNHRDMGSIKVNKYTDLNGDGVWNDSNETSNSNANNLGFRWLIDGAGYTFGTTVNNEATNLSNYYHTVDEYSPVGYHFVGWYVNGGRGSCANPDGTTLPLIPTITKDHTTEITLCNTKDTGTIKVIKDVVPNDSGATGWDFSIAGPTDHTVSNLHDGGQSSAYTSNVGSYTITETGHSGTSASNYTTTYSCLNSTAPITSGSGRVASFTLSANQNIVCTFTNTRDTGSIRIQKNIIPHYDGNDGPEYTMSLTGPTNSQWTLGDGALGTVSAPTGNYTITESAYTPSGAREGNYSATYVCYDYSPAGVPDDTISGSGKSVHFTLEKNHTMSCTFTNTLLGSIKIIKVANPSTYQDFSFHTSNNLDVHSHSFTVEGDNSHNTKLFDGLSAGQYWVSEDGENGWHLDSINCTGDTPVIDGNKVTLTVTNQDIVCTFTNTKVGSIEGYKWSDLNGNGKWDQQICHDGHWEWHNWHFYWHEGYCEGNTEPKLSGWTITLDASNNDEGPNPDVRSTTTDEHGDYSFDNVLPGTYQVCEVQQDGWINTYPGSLCQTVTIPEGNGSKDNNYDCDKDNNYDINNVNFGNKQQLNPILTITKSNDTGGADRHPGDTVLFTITVAATQSAVNNVTVTDLPAGGFSYVAGSWTALSSLRGDLKAGGTTPEPTYHSPGVWTLGNMPVNDTVVLTYKATIDGAEQSGLYKDLAWAQGTSILGNNVLANAENPGYVNPTYVGTQVNIVANDVGDTSAPVTTVGAVLGASTELPSTGANPLWLELGAALMILGVGSIVAGLKYPHKRRLHV